jgi:hypothetical protein
VAVDDTERARVKAWLAAQRWLAERQREERRRAGPDPAAAQRELLDMWRPGPRDPAGERAAEAVACQWARIHERARAKAKRGR